MLVLALFYEMISGNVNASIISVLALLYVMISGNVSASIISMLALLYVMISGNVSASIISMLALLYVMISGNVNASIISVLALLILCKDVDNYCYSMLPFLLHLVYNSLNIFHFQQSCSFIFAKTHTLPKYK